MTILTGRKVYNGFALHPIQQIEYLYDSADGGNPDYIHPVMNVKAWNEHNQRTASITPEGDPLMLSDVFYDTLIPGTDMTFQDQAKNVLQEFTNAKRDKDIQRAASVITSKDYASFQETIILGQNIVNVRTGVLTGLFESISVPNLKGEWATFDDGIKYFNNVAEGTTVEPSGGTGSIVTVEIPKNEGAVAITDRASMVINNDNPYTRLSARLGEERLKNENAVVAAEIESNTAHTLTGVDFGTRTSMLSTTNPIDFWNTAITTFDGLNKNMFNLIVSKAFILNEYNNNDVVAGRGSSGGPPLQTMGNVNESVQNGVPGLVGGVRWATDNAISSSTAMWVLWDGSIKVFRGPLTLFGVRKEEIEYTKTVLRAYMTSETVEPDTVYQATGVAA
jgi:hypothetical protein